MAKDLRRSPRHAKAGDKEEKDVEEWKRSSEQERGEGMRTGTLGNSGRSSAASGAGTMAFSHHS